MASETIGRKLLKPKVGMILMLAMAVGIIMGPWMPQMPFWFMLSGPSIAIAFIVIMLLSIPIIFTYGELTAMLPFAGGEYNFARNAFGYKTAWVAGWFLILLYIIGTAFMGPATARMIQALLIFPDISESWILLGGIGFLAIFAALNTFTISLSAKFQFIMVIIFVVVGLATAGWFFGSGEWTVVTVTPFFTTGGLGFLVAASILVTMIIGFDCIPQMAEECNYPRRKHIWVMLASVLIAETIYAIICLANAGMMPTAWITEQIVVSPEIARILAGNIPAAIINLAGLAATLTCLNGFMIAASRVVFAMGRAGVLPPVFARTNKQDIPYVAIWSIFGVCVLMVLIGREAWLETLFVAAAFTTGIVYTITASASVALRKKYPEWPRPFKMPGGTGVGILGAIIGLAITAGVAYSMVVAIQTAWWVVGAWIVIGLVIYSWVAYQRRTKPAYRALTDIVLTPTDIPADRAA